MMSWVGLSPPLLQLERVILGGLVLFEKSFYDFASHSVTIPSLEKEYTGS